MVERYQDLALETKRIHRATRVKLIPIASDWCTLNYPEECIGLVWEVKSA